MLKLLTFFGYKITFIKTRVVTAKLCILNLMPHVHFLRLTKLNVTSQSIIENLTIRMEMIQKYLNTASYIH